MPSTKGSTGQMGKYGGKHPGDMGAPKSRGGSGGKSPKKQAYNMPGHAKKGNY